MCAFFLLLSGGLPGGGGMAVFVASTQPQSPAMMNNITVQVNSVSMVGNALKNHARSTAVEYFGGGGCVASIGQPFAQNVTAAFTDLTVLNNSVSMLIPELGVCVLAACGAAVC